MATKSYKRKYKYKPKNYNSKVKVVSPSNKEMAEKIVLLLLQKGFAKKEDSRSLELVYFKSFGAVEINIYTTIIKSNGTLLSRKTGSDAIRVCAVIPKDGYIRPLFSEKRVNRTSVDNTIERLSSRIDQCQDKIGEYIDKKCKDCGSLLYLSKSGRHVCSDLCFTYFKMHGLRYCVTCKTEMCFGSYGYYCKECTAKFKKYKDNKRGFKWKE